MITLLKPAAALLMLAALAACAAGSDASADAAQGGAVSVIVLGFWHGIIAPFTLIGEIINMLVPNALPWSFRFYETRGAGVLYDLGFFVGIFGGPSALLSGTSRRRVVRS